jgi:hypothetical protein
MSAPYGSGPSTKQQQMDRLETLFQDLAVRRLQERKQAEGTETGTFMSHGQSDANRVGGRWSAQNKSAVSGAKPSQAKPSQAWSIQRCPLGRGLVLIPLASNLR